MSILTTLKERFFSPEFLRFCIVGVLATAINYGVYYLCLTFTNPTVAYTLGYTISFVCNFFLSARFTFKKKASAKKGVGFALSHLINYGLQVGCLNLFLWLGLGAKVAPIPVWCICIPVNFLLVRFVFNKI